MGERSNSSAAAAVRNEESREDVRAVVSRAFDEQFPTAVFEALAAAVYVTDAEGRITFYNDAAAELWGCRPELGSARWCGSWRLLWPDGRPMAHDECPMAVALKEGRKVRGAEAIAERPDGTRVPFIPFPTPLRDAAGALVGAVNLLVDISDRKRAEEAGQWFASVIESSDDAILTKDLDGVIISWNKGAQRLFGYTADEAVGKSVTILIPPDRQDEEPGILERIRRGERIDHYETVRLRKDGSPVDISLTVSPVKDAGGRILGASKIARDITERKQAEERTKLLTAEVDHRAKNILAAVQAVATSTQADSVPEFVESFMGRLQAISRAHALLTESRWRGADLKRLVEEELAAFRSDEAKERVRLSGPPTSLPQPIAEALSMTLHELATNAAKYGALSVPAGRVFVEWFGGAGGQLVLRWTEAGGPPVRAPSRRGFGTRLIEKTADHLGGVGRLEWRAAGLVYEICIPANKLAH